MHMAAQTALVLNTKSYAPRGKNSGNVGAWALVGDTTFGGATSVASLRVSEPNKLGQSTIDIRLTIPKAASVSDSCACVGEVTSTAYFTAKVTVPSGFTAAERQDLRKRIQSEIADAVFTAAVDSLEPVW